jgi:hypothetical protein
MPPPIDVLLCEYETADGRRQLRAVLDELHLTYSIVERGRADCTRELRRHVASLREARQWASAHESARLHAPKPKGRRAA